MRQLKPSPDADTESHIRELTNQIIKSNDVTKDFLKKHYCYVL
ncbi:MAG: hypothetical protein FCKEOINB_01074 [Nitrosomonas sp.]|nr:hypothetical protein [Nitrosomonas sp.]